MMTGIMLLHACWKTRAVSSSDHSRKHTAALQGAQPPGLDATAQSSHAYPAWKWGSCMGMDMGFYRGIRMLLSPKCQQAPCQMSRAGIVNPCRQRHPAQADLLGSLFPCHPQNQLARRHRWGFACKKRDTAAQHHVSATTSSTLLQLL